MELRNVTRPKSCFHYDSLLRFLNHPANRVSFGMVCDLDTDFLLLAAGQNVKHGHYLVSLSICTTELIQQTN